MNNICVWFFITFFLRDKNTIVNKRKNWSLNRRQKSFWFYFKNVKDECNVKSRKIGERAYPWSTSTLALKNRETN